jgi:hypothetical protein
MAISSKRLIEMGKWKLLLDSLREGEHVINLPDRKKMESLRQTIARTKSDRPDKEFVYECCYRDKVLVVNKTKKE